MTRRLTISGSRSEMGLLAEPQEPETPPPSWTPPGKDFWRKPSKWQICMPRLRFIAKVLVSFVFLVVLFKVLGQQPPPPPPPPDEPPPPLLPETPDDIEPLREEWREPTEAEMIEFARREEWIWKDFDLYVQSPVY